MKPLRSVITATAAVLLVVLVAGAAGAWAATSVVDRRGHVLTVDVVVNPADPAQQGLRIRDQEVGGEPISELLYQTYDPVLDIGPQMGIDPLSGDPVLVWSRWDGADFELAMTRRLPDATWDQIDLVTSNYTGDVEPRFVVDQVGAARVLWWPQGSGGPVHLQAFDTNTGTPIGPPERPLESSNAWTGHLVTNVIGAEEGGGDDPGVTGGASKSKASALPCLSNPGAAPEHGVLMSCGRAAVYQLSSCQLVVGVYDPAAQQWRQSVLDLGSVSLLDTTVRDVAQGVADGRCTP